MYTTKITFHQSNKLKNMIRAHGWSMTSLADLTLGRYLQSAIAEMVAGSVHVIAFIIESDCWSRRKLLGWMTGWEWEMYLPLSILERDCHTLRAHRVFPVISCDLETYSQHFPNLAQFNTAHIEDANFEEKLVKTIAAGKEAMLSEGIYFMANYHIYSKR